MGFYLDFALGVLAPLVPIGAVFVALAVVTKRRAVLAAFRDCTPEAATNVGLFVINYLILGPLMVLAAFALSEALPEVPGLSAFWNGLPWPVAFGGALVAIEVAGYWRHRLGHTPEMWRYHATHHADEALHWFSVTRKHPVDKLLEMLLDTLPALLLGVPLWAVASAQVLRAWWGHFIHADVPWTLGPLKRVLVSPAAHRLHHVRDEALMGSNFANMLAIVDVVFGTFADPTPHVNCATGIAEGTRGTFGELVRPWEARYRRAAARTKEGAAA